jgi:predicted dehydrogenase
MNKIKVGVLGATRGWELSEAALFDHPWAELAAICEKFEFLREATETKFMGMGRKVKCYSNFDDLLSSDIDALVLANYGNEHAPYAVKALKAGKHVLSEVQPCQNLAEAVKLCEAVEQSGKVYAYAENYCYRNTAFEMRQRYDRGDIGEISGANVIFFNDLSKRWPRLTRGERDNWRNLVPSTFYCSHSIGPVLFITGRRPVNVVGMETPNLPYMRAYGARSGSAGLELMQFDNGAFVCSMHGNMSRGWLPGCDIYGTQGAMESDKYNLNKLHVVLEKDLCRWTHEEYEAEPYIPYDNQKERVLRSSRLEAFYAVEFFLGTIIGDEISKKYTIDVYQALDMGLPGLLAYRSIVNGSVPFEVPDFRDKARREKYRNDYTCTDPKVAAGDQLLPPCKSGNIEIPDSVYEKVAELFRMGLTD